MTPTPRGYGFVTVSTSTSTRISNVTVADGESYTATTGGPVMSRRIRFACGSCSHLLGALLAPLPPDDPGVRRDQYAYAGPDGRSHLLLHNLSNASRTASGWSPTATARAPGRGWWRCRRWAAAARRRHARARRPRADAAGAAPRGQRLVNLYLVGAGPRDLAGPLSLCMSSDLSALLSATFLRDGATSTTSS